MFNRKTIHTCICSALATSAAGVPFASWASESSQLEEIIVTAQKKAESVQKVPISIQALDALAIEKASLLSLGDLKASVPGLTVVNFPLAQESTLFLRIRGNQNFAMDSTIDQSVAVHINGVYIARGDGLNIASDLERIEVLKGPQGTLVGRNASSGAVNIITAKPELDGFYFKQQVTVATRGELTTKTAINLPFSDTFAARLSYIHQGKDEADSGIKNDGLGPQLGKSKADSFRLDMRWKPASGILVDYGYDYSKNKWQDLPFQCLGPSPLTFNPSQCNWTYQPFVTSLTSMPDDQLEVQGHTLNVEWELSPSMTARSITGYRKLEETFYKNMISTPGNFIYTAGPIPGVSGGTPGAVLGGGAAVPLPSGSLPSPLDQNQISQEFQLLGKPTKYFNYVGGIYYFQEEANQSTGQFSWLPHQNIPTLGGINNLVSLSPLYHVRAKNTSWAVYGQFNWRPDILDRKLEIVPGLRYTRDTRYADKNAPGTVSYLINNPLALAGFLAAAGVPKGTSLLQLGPQAATVQFNNTLNFSKATPNLTVQYHIDDAMMGYAKVIKGYRSGGFSLADNDAARAAKGFAPEDITSTEVGFKGELMERRLRANAAYFVMNYTNQQMTIATSAGAQYTAGIFNAGKSETSGLELDLQFAASENLRFGLNWAALDMKYKEVIDPDPASATYGSNIASRLYRSVPKNAYSATMDYRFRNLGLPGKLDMHLEYTHIDKYVDVTMDLNSIARFKTNTGVAPTVSQFISWGETPAFSIWNGRLGLNEIKVGPNGNGDLSIGLWGKNLLDKKYISYVLGGDAFAGTGGTGFGRWGQRRTVGLDFIYRY